MTLNIKEETFISSLKVLVEPGYLNVTKNSFSKNKPDESKDGKNDNALFEVLKKYKKGDIIDISSFDIREGETSPPKRYNSGSIILAWKMQGSL